MRGALHVTFKKVKILTLHFTICVLMFYNRTIALCVCHSRYAKSGTFAFKNSCLNTSTDEAGLTPLYVACGHMHKEVIEALLSSYGYIDATHSEVQSPLAYTAKQLIEKVIQPLSNKGVKIDPPKLKSVQMEGEYVHALNVPIESFFRQSKPLSLYITQTITYSDQTKVNFQCISQSKEDLIHFLGFTVSISSQYLDIYFCLPE